MGIQINRVISATFIIGTFLAAVGSILFFTNYPGVVPTSGAMPGLKAAGSTDPADVLEVLPSVKYEGVTGAIAFDDIGDALRDSAFVKQCNTELGVWDFVSVATVG